ncbi:MAG: hypothetical protein ACR2NO_08245 [Chloroflexota bacterium]
MPPRPFQMIVDRGRRMALGAHPTLALRQRHPDMYFAGAQVGLDSFDLPSEPVNDFETLAS